MGLFGKIFKRHDTIPASGPETTRVDKMPIIPPASPDQTIRDLPKPEENKYDPAKRVDMTREELIAGIAELEKTDKEKANALRKALGIPEKQ